MRPILLFALMPACAVQPAVPTCVIDLPDEAPLSVYSSHAFEGSVSNAPAGTAAVWTSSVDGPFDGSALDPQGRTQGLLRDPTPGVHSITFTASAAGDTVCMAEATVRVADVPRVRITSPSSGAPQPEAVPVTLTAEVQGGLGQASWRSDVDGVLAVSAVVDSLTSTQATLSVGSHLLTVEVQGAEGASQAVTRLVVNGRPSRPEVTLTAPVTAEHDLIATTTLPATDPDDDGLVLRYAWSVNGRSKPALLGPVVPASMLHRDEVWSVSVRADDGVQTGEAFEASATVDNAPPAFAAGFLLPTTFDRHTRPTCHPRVSDADHDAIGVTLSWTVNGEPVGTSPQLPFVPLERGDMVGCLARATDGHVTTDPFLVAEVAVGNSLPVVDRAEISPRVPKPGQTVSCTSTLSDPDGDAVTDDVTWVLDGQVVGFGDTIEAPDVPGARLICSVRAYDGIDLGLPRTTYVTVHEPIEPQNVLLIVLDDIGVERLGAYGMGTAPPPTPNIDELAAQGVMFTRAWATPMCSSTRAAYLTGKHGFRTGMGRATSSYDGWPLDDAEVTIPEMLARLAPSPYATATVGKWHLSNHFIGHTQAVLDQGFDIYEGVPGNLRPESTLDGGLQNYYNYEWTSGGVAQRYTSYLTTRETNTAIAVMNDLAEPWFLHVAYHAAHLPAHKPPRELYTGATLTNSDSTQRLLDADTEAVDTEIGRLLAAVPDDTTIILIGDNGTAQYAASGPFPRNRVKNTIYEGGVRMPLIVAGPLVNDPGATSDALVHVVDIFATVAELGGVDMPNDDISQQTDSESFLPFVLDPAHPSYRDVLYTEVFQANGFGPYEEHARTVRNDRYKLAWTMNSGYRFHELGHGWLDQIDLLDGSPLVDDAARNFDDLLSVLEGPRFTR